ncbi:AAA family ATPase [Eubacterium barkeri]|uniref:ATPase family associated with various cellular activities (AAA) n=1 Tax=Eubacterium barkeri TaxID=1528 RepID=A0A1H3G7N6_EUBBA|nr:AAA family ATPase [Eubacterium barkeri]SDX99296.1 ATPase family associated with various cellular activities (AAA) [Eubacterium barkeri]
MNIKKTTHPLTTKYLSEDTSLTRMIEEHLSKHETVLLIAPQGTGKTTYIQSLQNKDFINTVVGLFPTRMLSKQQRKNGQEAGFTHSTTYFSSEDYLKWMDFEGLSDHDTLIFIDEIHKIIQYSAFAYEEQTVPALSIIEKATKNPCILATATPDYLYHCCTDEPFYQSIDIIIEVQTQKEYIKHLTLLDGYSKREDALKALVRKNHKADTKQIILLNNTKKCDAWAEEFQQSGIHALSIHSKTDREHPTIQPIYESITNNGTLNCEILIATSWIDIGISFKDENITNLYCILTDNWTDGDFTMIKQFMARARKSTPHLYMTRPKLTYDEQEYLKYMRSHTETNGLLSPGTDFYKELEQDIIHTARNQAELINQHKIKDQSSFYAMGCQKIGDRYTANSMHCKYYLDTLYEKKQIESFKDDDITKEILSKHFNIEVEQIDIHTYTPEATGLTPEEEQAVILYLEELYTTQKKFAQKELCTKIRTITNDKKNYEKAGQFLKNTFIGGEQLNTLFKLARKNGGKYQIEKIK